MLFSVIYVGLGMAVSSDCSLTQQCAFVMQLHEKHFSSHSHSKLLCTVQKLSIKVMALRTCCACPDLLATLIDFYLYFFIALPSRFWRENLKCSETSCILL